MCACIVNDCNSHLLRCFFFHYYYSFYFLRVSFFIFLFFSFHLFIYLFYMYSWFLCTVVCLCHQRCHFRLSAVSFFSIFFFIFLLFFYVNTYKQFSARRQLYTLGTGYLYDVDQNCDQWPFWLSSVTLKITSVKKKIVTQTNDL